MVHYITKLRLVLCMAIVIAGVLIAKTLHHPKELPLVISVCAYNDARWVEKNLDSIFMQKYSNYHVVYIDDASTDNTPEIVKEYIARHHLEDKITLQVNPTRCRKMQNIYNLFHACDDHDIIVQVDADDWLPHDQIFSLINSKYQNENIWLTYGQFRGYPNNRTGPVRALPEHVVATGTFREWGWEYLHLRTFYAWLFKSIKLEDFISELTPGFEGKFFPVQNDSASYYPMLEMAGNRIEFIPDITYIYNETNPLCGVRVDFKLHENTGIDIKKNRKKYAKLDAPIYNRLDEFQGAQADLIILAQDPYKNLLVLLDSTSKLKGIKDIYVVGNELNKTDLESLQSRYTNVRFISALKDTFCATLRMALQKCKQQHVVLCTDALFVQDPIDVCQCILELEKTFAHGFYLGFSHAGFPFNNENTDARLMDQHVHDNIYTWKFNCSYDQLCNNIDMTLLRKQSVLKDLNQIEQKLSDDNMQSFIISWQNKEHSNMKNIGLFFDTLKVGGLHSQPQQTLLAYNARGKNLII
ncbi:MAG: glycosyltransferase family 2 protein [Candidatus Babeliales bacterium]